VIGSNVARRYAKAIFEIGVESQNLQVLVDQVASLADAYAESPDLQRALDNPLVAHEAKKAILTEVADRAGVIPIVKHTLLLLGDRRRLHALPAIA
jgi:F-type H+-transporting ATPase subunit delta